MSYFETIKGVANVLKEAGKIDEYTKILELLDVLLEKNGEIDRLNIEIKGLRSKLKVSEDYIFKNNSYWHKDNNDGPFCSRCYDKNKELIRLIPRSITSDYANCHECQNQVNVTGREKKVRIVPVDDCH